jgi:DNA-binding transcriptional ArsR family regulator
MDENEAVITYFEALMESGITLTKTDVWILLNCQASRMTIKQLATRKGVSYQSIYQYIKPLVKIGMLDEKKIGGENYYKCTINLEDLEDPTIRVKVGRQQLNFEEVIGYLGRNIAQAMQNSIRQGLGRIYQRALQAEQDTPVEGQTSEEIRKNMEWAYEEYMKFGNFLKQILELPIYQDNRHVLNLLRKEGFKYPNTEERLSILNTRYRTSMDNKSVADTKKMLSNPKELAKENLEADPDN